MLSYIENGEAKLKNEIALKFADRFNFIMKIPKENITSAYLLESPDTQIKKISKLIVSNLKNISSSTIEALRETFTKYEFKYEQVKIFFVIGHHLKTRDIKNSELIFEEILEISIINNIKKFLFNIILELQRIYSKQGNFEKTIFLYNKVTFLLNEFSSKINGYILYNFALAFQVNNEINKAIILYEKSKPLLENTAISFYAKNNLTICYMNIYKYEKSKKLILELLELRLSDIEKSKCYTNLIMNSIYSNDKICLKLTIPKLEVLLNILERTGFKKYQSYYCLGRASLILKERHNAMNNFERELELGIGENKNHFFIDQYEYCIEQLLNIYHPSEINKFKKLEFYILKIPVEMFNKDFFIKVAPKFLLVYSKNECINFFEKIGTKLNISRL